MDSVARATAIAAVIVAVYGAVLSTLHEIRAFRDRKLRLRVSLALVATQPIPGNPSRVHTFIPPPGGPQARVLALKAENVGQRVVTLTALGLLPPNGDFFPLPVASNSAFPRRLEPGESCHDSWPADEVARSLRAAGFRGNIPLGGCYTDGLNTRHSAKPLAFDIDAWSRDG